MEEGALHGETKKRRRTEVVQVLATMGLTGCPAGLIINFNVAKLIDGVKRLINPHVCGR